MIDEAAICRIVLQFPYQVNWSSRKMYRQTFKNKIKDFLLLEGIK